MQRADSRPGPGRRPRGRCPAGGGRGQLVAVDRGGACAADSGAIGGEGWPATNCPGRGRGSAARWWRWRATGAGPAGCAFRCGAAAGGGRLARRGGRFL